MTDTAETTTLPARQAPRPDPTPAPAIAEPATGRALWPTFMRRTLAEDEVLRQRSALARAE